MKLGRPIRLGVMLNNELGHGVIHGPPPPFYGSFDSEMANWWNE